MNISELRSYLQPHTGSFVVLSIVLLISSITMFFFSRRLRIHPAVGHDGVEASNNSQKFIALCALILVPLLSIQKIEHYFPLLFWIGIAAVAFAVMREAIRARRDAHYVCFIAGFDSLVKGFLFAYVINLLLPVRLEIGVLALLIAFIVFFGSGVIKNKRYFLLFAGNLLAGLLIGRIEYQMYYTVFFAKNFHLTSMLVAVFASALGNTFSRLLLSEFKY